MVILHFSLVVRKPTFAVKRKPVFVVFLTHISLASFLLDNTHRVGPDVTSQNAVSHLGPFCLLTGISLKNEIKMPSYSCFP